MTSLNPPSHNVGRNNDPVVYPSEAFLLGLSFGECSSPTGFRSVIQSRVAALLPEPNGFGAIWLQHVLAITADIAEPLLLPTLARISRHNLNAFEAGRPLGRILSQFGCISELLSGLEPDTEQMQQAVQTALEDPLIGGTYFAKQNCERVQCLISEIATDIANRDDWTDQVVDAVSAIWMAVGEMLGVLRGEDAHEIAVDARSLVPRDFNVGVEDSMEHITDRVVLAEQALATQATEKMAAFVVSGTYQAIESLVRLVFPGDFVRPDARVGLVLKQRRQPGNGADTSKLALKFAHIASTLQLTYRNPASHRMSDFRCSPAEAKFFLAGIVALCDIASGLINEGVS